MSRRKPATTTKGAASPPAPRFFERVRRELGRYAEGVHDLGAPATDAELALAERRLGRPLPEAYRELTQTWNGLRLFCDTFLVGGFDRIALRASEPDPIWAVGEALGAPLELDNRGRLFEVDEEGERLLVGSTLERWLTAVLLREAVLVDSVGEWKDVFDDEEGGISIAARRKRQRLGVRVDPEAAAWHLEAAELSFEEGEVEPAIEALEQAVTVDPSCAAAWQLLGTLRRQQERAGAVEAFVAAAAASNSPSRRAQRYAEAARLSRGATERDEFGALALAADPTCRHRWLVEARRLLDEGDEESAANVAQLADAVRSDEESLQLLQRLRLRQTLRPV